MIRARQPLQRRLRQRVVDIRRGDIDAEPHHGVRDGTGQRLGRRRGERDRERSGERQRNGGPPDHGCAREPASIAGTIKSHIHSAT